jgi:hypothetical protein
MESPVRQYEIQPREINLPWSKKVVLFFAVSFFMFGFRWVIESFLHDKHQPILEALIMPVVVGAWCAYRPLNPWLLQGSGSLIIGDDFIKRNMGATWFGYKKRIRRDQIKSISEGQRGLRVMDRGKFGSIMLGFIFVPATMPEYQEIKATLAQWSRIEGQG